jgi:hypothetical protein
MCLLNAHCEQSVNEVSSCVRTHSTARMDIYSVTRQVKLHKLSQAVYMLHL